MKPWQGCIASEQGRGYEVVLPHSGKWRGQGAGWWCWGYKLATPYGVERGQQTIGYGAPYSTLVPFVDACLRFSATQGWQTINRKDNT